MNASELTYHLEHAKNRINLGKLLSNGYELKNVKRYGYRAFHVKEDSILWQVDRSSKNPFEAKLNELCNTHPDNSTSFELDVNTGTPFGRVHLWVSCHNFTITIGLENRLFEPISPNSENADINKIFQRIDLQRLLNLEYEITDVVFHRYRTRNIQLSKAIDTGIDRIYQSDDKFEKTLARLSQAVCAPDNHSSYEFRVKDPATCSDFYLVARFCDDSIWIGTVLCNEW